MTLLGVGLQAKDKTRATVLKLGLSKIEGSEIGGLAAAGEDAEGVVGQTQ
jgi:hypothetical protein